MSLNLNAVEEGEQRLPADQTPVPTVWRPSARCDVYATRRQHAVNLDESLADPDHLAFAAIGFVCNLSVVCRDRYYYQSIRPAGLRRQGLMSDEHRNESAPAVI